MKELKKNKGNNRLRYFTTYFDANYLPKAIVMFDSLKRCHPNFIIYAFCFDDISYNILKKINYNSVTPIHYKEFGTKKLLNGKSGKSRYYEYYWSYVAGIALQSMNQIPPNDLITYIDSDLMFFDNPEVIFKEIEFFDVLIQPNNYSVQESHQLPKVGYYCSGYVTFRNNDNGRRILSEWDKMCTKWCLAKFDNGKFGDQKYLDFWKGKYPKVREITNVGADVAPWNIQKYNVTKTNGKILINTVPLVYYHFHSFKMRISDLSFMITGDRHNNYIIPDDAIKIIYKEYINRMKQAILMLKGFSEYKNYVRINPDSNVRLIAANSKDEFKNSLKSKQSEKVKR